MSGKRYLKQQLPVVLLNLSGMTALSLFLTAAGETVQTALFIAGVWTAVLCAYLSAAFYVRKRQMDRLTEMAEQLSEKYLLPELMGVPKREDDRVFYDLMKMAEKSMLEKIAEIQNERKEYKEYNTSSSGFTRSKRRLRQ